MTRVSAAAVAAAVATAASVGNHALAQTYSNANGVYTITQDTGGEIPLASKHFQWPYLPYQADTGNGPRGTQQGYNLCNATTQNQDSMCQTGYINAIDDFCLWGSPKPAETVADVEEEMVAYCTKKKYGARMLTAGSIQGIQVIRTPDYIEIVGMVDQTALNLTATDSGGEEDPHGADQRGNPLGSLLYSSAFTGNPNYTQVIEWSYFVGSGVFCFKACDPAGPRAAELCQHTYDRVGCTYNAPANYGAINGTFQSCKGDDQLPVGVYVTNGVTSTWTQPPESLGVISTIPFTAAIPATSDCTTYTSSAIYTELLSSATAAPSASKSGSSASRSGASSTSGGPPAATGSGGGSSSGAVSAQGGVKSVGAVVGVVVAGLFSIGMVMVA